MRKKISYRSIISFMISSAIAIAVYFTNGIFFCVNDDYEMARIVANDKLFHKGEYFVFCNITLGKLLKGLYKINACINWYGVLMIALLVISFSILIYIFWNTSKNILAAIPVIIIEILSIFYISFSTAGFIFTATSVLAIVYIIKNEKYLKTKKVVIGLVVASILFLFGFMFRKLSCLVAIVVLVPLLIYYREKISRKIIIGIIINVALIISLNAFHNYSYNHGEFRDYNNYLKARDIVDQKPIDYRQHKTELKKIGISQNDLECFYHWIYADRQVFSERKLKQISQIRSWSEKYNLDVVDIIKQMATNEMMWALLLIGIIGLICVKKRKYILMTFVIAFACSLVLIIMNRFIGRVYIPMTIIGILEILFFVANNRINKRVIMMMVGTVVCLSAITAYKAYSMQKDYISYKNNEEVSEYINSQRDKFFVMNSSAHDVISTSRRSIFDKPNFESNMETVGGWRLYHPFYYKKTKNIVSNPERLLISMINDKNILYIDGKNDDRNYKRIEKYLTEHTSKIIKRQVVKEFPGKDIEISRIMGVD